MGSEDQAKSSSWVSCYGNVRGRWKAFCSMRVLDYFAPLGDLSTFVFIIVLIGWTAIVVATSESIPIDAGDLERTVGILTTALAFVLPLRLNAALAKHHSGIDSYNAFCGDVLALVYEMEAFGVKKGKAYDACHKLPALVLHHFKGDMSDVKVRNIFALLEIDSSTYDMAVEKVLFSILPFIKDNGPLMRKWEQVYGSWGNMGNIFGYKPPRFLSYLLNTSLLAYTFLLPFTLPPNYNAIWMAFLIAYLYIGINTAGANLGNPFEKTNHPEEVRKTKVDIMAAISEKGLTTSLVQLNLVY